MQRSSSRAALWMACVLCALSASRSAAAPGDLPTVRVLRIHSVTATSVTLNAAVELNGSPGGGGFEYGPDTHYGSGLTFTPIEERLARSICPLSRSPAWSLGVCITTAPLPRIPPGSVYSEDHTFIAGNNPPYAQDDEYTQRDGTGPFELPVVGNAITTSTAPLSQIVAVTQPAHGHVRDPPRGDHSFPILCPMPLSRATISLATRLRMLPAIRATGHVRVMHVGRLPVVSTVLFASGDGDCRFPACRATSS